MTDYELEKSIKQNTIIINNYNNTTVNKDLKTLFQMMDGLDDMKKELRKRKLNKLK